MQCGHFEQAATTIDKMISPVEMSLDTFETPELLRARAEIWLAQPKPDPVAAEQALQRSVDLARLQGALALELRSATVLARHWLAKSRKLEATDLLVRIFEKFTEGFDTTDLKAARRVLDELEYEA